MIPPDMIPPARSRSGHSGHGLPAATAGNTRALQISGILTGVYFVIELHLHAWTHDRDGARS